MQISEFKKHVSDFSEEMKADIIIASMKNVKTGMVEESSLKRRVQNLWAALEDAEDAFEEAYEGIEDILESMGLEEPEEDEGEAEPTEDVDKLKDIIREIIRQEMAPQEDEATPEAEECIAEEVEEPQTEESEYEDNGEDYEPEEEYEDGPEEEYEDEEPEVEEMAEEVKSDTAAISEKYRPIFEDILKAVIQEMTPDEEEETEEDTGTEYYPNPVNPMNPFSY